MAAIVFEYVILSIHTRHTPYFWFQESCCSNDDPSYKSKLENDTLESLRRIKREMKTKKQLKADMWCHFGMFIIRRPLEGIDKRGKN